VCSGTDAYQSAIGPADRGTVNYLRLSGQAGMMVRMRNPLVNASSIVLLHVSFVFVTVIAILYSLFSSL
jgi:hypothetical protein